MAQVRLRSLETKPSSDSSVQSRPGASLAEAQTPVAAPPILYLVVMIILGLIIPESFFCRRNDSTDKSDEGRKKVVSKILFCQEYACACKRIG